MRVVARIVAVVLVALATYGCLAPQSAVMVGVDLDSWIRVKSVVYENDDTLSLRNLNIAIRYNSNFEENTLPLKLAIMAPDNRIFQDTISLQLERPSTAVAVSTTESRPYRTDVLLNQRGAYIFAFKPLTEVKGVEAIGIELK